MRLLHIGRTLLCCVAGFASLISMASAQSESDSARQRKSQSCPNDNAGVTLPPGFCATVFADGIGHARNVAVSPSGLVYVNTWSGRYYGNDVPPQADSW
jgi:glucose/arabinose dehydrogenase